MSHARVFYYALVALVGIVALAVSSFGVVRSRVPAYWYLIGFYAGFTLLVCTIFVREYIYVNVADYSIVDIFRTYAVSNVVEPFFLASLGLFLHRLAGVRRIVSRDIVVVAFAGANGALGFLPGAVTVDKGAMTLRLGPLMNVSSVLYMSLFAYVLLLTVVNIRRDRPPREVVLVITLLVFGIVGFLESLLGTIGGFAVSEVVLGSAGSTLLVSTFPYVAYGAVLIYFFGAYLLADSRPAGTLDYSFVERFGISPRESEVIDLLNRGLSNREIAEKLFVSLATVKTHAHNIYEKTGATSRYDLYHITRGTAS